MIYHGHKAIAAFEQVIGRKADAMERRLVWLEGFADEEYLDHKGIKTKWLGQTAEWLNRSPIEVIDAHRVRCMNRFPEYVAYPDYLKRELLQAEYRGDLGHSPATCQLIRARQYGSAAIEFLDNVEYNSAPPQIRKRMEAVSHALNLYETTREV